MQIRFFWILQPYFSTNVKKVSASFYFLLLRLLTFIISLSLETKKKLNSFTYNAIAKHCLVIKLGEPKSDQKNFARQIRKSWSLEK